MLGIYVDFSKAFDNINHLTLFEKLESYGIRGHCFALIKSYLASRQQFVQIDKHCSSMKPISKGVPQGSVLGPLLFNAYINDLTNIYLSAKYVLYADDASIFVSGTNCTDIESETDLMLSKLRDWSIMNQLEINTKKKKKKPKLCSLGLKISQ